MIEREQFIAFVESLKTEDNAHTISAITEGYEAYMEAGLMKKIGKAAMPYAAAASILGAGAAGAFDESDLIEYQQSEQARMQYGTPQISKMIQQHESSIKSGDAQARAKAYDALKAAKVRAVYDQASNFKFYHDDNLGRDFHTNGQEVTGEEKQNLPMP